MSAEPDAKSAAQRCYGRGLMEGLRLAGITNPGEFMNIVKMQRIENGLTGIARKVLDAVPIKETWNSTRIMQELARAGTKTDRRMVDGCLQSLKDSGLVKEPITGNWMRVPPREPSSERPLKELAQAVIQDSESPSETSRAAPGKSAASPIDALAGLADQMRSMVDGLTKIAAGIDDAALACVEQAQQADKELAAVRQFKALMRQIGD